MSLLGCRHGMGHYELFKYIQIIAGVFEGRNPVLLVRDPELIKIVAIRDFEHFTDRNTLKSREPQYVKRQLLNLRVSALIY